MADLYTIGCEHTRELDHLTPNLTSTHLVAIGQRGLATVEAHQLHALVLSTNMLCVFHLVVGGEFTVDQPTRFAIQTGTLEEGQPVT